MENHRHLSGGGGGETAGERVETTCVGFVSRLRL